MSLASFVKAASPVPAADSGLDALQKTFRIARETTSAAARNARDMRRIVYRRGSEWVRLLSRQEIVGSEPQAHQRSDRPQVRARPTRLIDEHVAKPVLVADVEEQPADIDPAADRHGNVELTGQVADILGRADAA